MSSKIQSLAFEKLNCENGLNDEIELLSEENEILKEKFEKINSALSTKITKIDGAFDLIQLLTCETESLSSLNQNIEDKYVKLLFEKKQFTEQKEKYEKLIESLKRQNEKLLDELNHQQMALIKVEKTCKA